MQLSNTNGGNPMIDSRVQSSRSSHLDALRARHLAMSNEIKEDRKHASFDDVELRAKKKERLLLKDRIKKIRQSS